MSSAGNHHVSGTGLERKLIRILLLEDSEADAQLSIRKLQSSGLSVQVDMATSSGQFKRHVADKLYDIVLADYRIPSWTGLEAFHWLRASGYSLPFILVTGTLGEDTAVESIKQGVSDYVLKKNLERLPMALIRALEDHALRLDRDRAERELRQSTEEYRSIIEGAPYGIVRSKETGEVVMANPAMLEMLGYSAEELSQLNAGEVYLDPADRKRIFEQLNHEPFSICTEVKVHTKGGKQVHVLLAGKRVPKRTEEEQLYEFFVQDVSQQRALEQQFLQAQKMEAVGRLAGGVAHDFNNLLMIIGGYTELLQQQVLPEKVAGYISQIQNASKMAASVVRQLLAFSRRQVPERHILDLNTIVTDLKKMLPRLLGEDVDLVIVPGEALNCVSADRGHMEQIIMNLAVNARDAMPEGGRMTIQTANALVDNEYLQQNTLSMPPGSYVTLSVTDTGTGMDEETQAHIFEPFFTTKEHGKGTGLGLATVYGIAKQSEGHITVQSAPGNGTCFTLYFPAALMEGTKQRQAKSAGPVLTGHETILLVEDEPDLREITREYLEPKGYKVLSAGSGEAALQLVRAHEGAIHVLLTDLIMPGIRGQELAKTLRKLHPALNIIFVSGYSDQPVAIEEYGPNAAYLQKPVSLGDLGISVRTLLDRRPE
ncbi:MAG: hypothetical protein DMG65_03550 [Candidatus Angelobacter sp. Gp1-AA117]|nr:MAG: hypothetical protein DMG65_03550 [Candidatus Angelobacter sp. Gp1-AA117]